MSPRKKLWHLDFQAPGVVEEIERGRWMRVYQEGKRELLEGAPSLSGECRRVLDFLETVMQYGNRVPRVGEMAKAMGMHQSHASRAYRSLVKAGFLVEYDATYRLNPLVYWKGPERGRAAMLREIASGIHARVGSEGERGEGRE